IRMVVRKVPMSDILASRASGTAIVALHGRYFRPGERSHATQLDATLTAARGARTIRDADPTPHRERTIDRPRRAERRTRARLDHRPIERPPRTDDPRVGLVRPRRAELHLHARRQ